MFEDGHIKHCFPEIYYLEEERLVFKSKDRLTFKMHN